MTQKRENGDHKLEQQPDNGLTVVEVPKAIPEPRQPGGLKLPVAEDPGRRNLISGVVNGLIAYV